MKDWGEHPATRLVLFLTFAFCVVAAFYSHAHHMGDTTIAFIVGAVIAFCATVT